MKAPITSGASSTKQEEPMTKPKSSSTTLATVRNIMSGEKKNKVVKLRLATGEGSGYEDWLIKIKDGTCFAVRPRKVSPHNDPSLAGFQKVSATGRICTLYEIKSKYNKVKTLVDTYWFSQIYECRGEYKDVDLD